MQISVDAIRRGRTTTAPDFEPSCDTVSASTSARGRGSHEGRPVEGGVRIQNRIFRIRDVFLFATLFLGGCGRAAGEAIVDIDVVDHGNHNAEWEDGTASWDEFGHDNDPSVCGIKVLTVEEWEKGRYWERNKPVLVKNATEGWAALERWRLTEMLRRYPDADATMGDAREIATAGSEDRGVLIPTTVGEFIKKHMYDPSRYFFDRRIGIPKGMVDDLRPFPMPTRAFLEGGKDVRRSRWKDHLTISIGADKQGLTFHGHGEAWNVVIFGAKRWILWEDTNLNDKMQKQMVLHPKTGRLEPAHEWVRGYEKNELRRKEIRANGRDCIQRAGEMMFVPGMVRHMVVNIGDTVAVVSEVDQDMGRKGKKARPMLEELLMAESSSARAKLLRRHLCPGAAVVRPNGETVDLVGDILVAEFVTTFSGALTEINGLVKEGKMDRSLGMNWVKRVRGVVVEARAALAKCFGEGSDEVKELERALRNIFRE